MLISSSNRQSRLFWTESVTTEIRHALVSAGNVTLTFLLRLAILLQAKPIFHVPEYVLISGTILIEIAISVLDGASKKYLCSPPHQ
ncbi:hypothetical protein NGJ72_07870 [Escherichia whittamii]|nr:hypothetical protein [Escherichia whittamii]MEB7936594.1 hypothetical protein [Escherichia whittamii]